MRLLLSEGAASTIETRRTEWSPWVGALHDDAGDAVALLDELDDAGVQRDRRALAEHGLRNYPVLEEAVTVAIASLPVRTVLG